MTIFSSKNILHENIATGKTEKIMNATARLDDMQIVFCNKIAHLF